MNNILLKGKSSSTASNSELEQADSTATIRLLTTKYGLTKGSKYAAMGETPSRIHWLLEGGQHFVHPPLCKKASHRRRTARARNAGTTAGSTSDSTNNNRRQLQKTLQIDCFPTSFR